MKVKNDNSKPKRQIKNRACPLLFGDVIIPGFPLQMMTSAEAI